jgi:hypothetical protein
MILEKKVEKKQNYTKKAIMLVTKKRQIYIYEFFNQ